MPMFDTQTIGKALFLKHKKFKNDNVMQCVTSVFLGDADIVTIDASNGKVIKLLLLRIDLGSDSQGLETVWANRSRSMTAEKMTK
jgi:hypothetical protein